MIMRSQGCTIQQALTPEAAAVVKQAVALAKRRGHAQVTPLHVAHTMLSVSSGLFRAACIQANSHPLHCRALELCFNVALQRLPTSTASPMLGPLSGPTHQPSIANALVAAFKRAQAHQRRGVIENQQQQPILAVKIELEQLIISILDDPSVSRVMKEAGFSSPLVKAKVEQALSMELGSQNQAPNENNSNTNIKPKVGSTKPRPSDRNEDVMSVIDSLMTKKKRNLVLVGECLETLEGLAREVMERVEKGEVPEGLKGLKFIKLSFSSFGNLSTEEVEQKISELKCLIKSYNKGVVLYLDDLKWVIDFRAASNNTVLRDQHLPRRSFDYCPIEQVIKEIRDLALENDNECKRLWLIGIATFQTYMRCRSGEPSLESIWDLHAITIPASSLGLSLIPDSDLHLQSPLASKKVNFHGSGWLMLERAGGGVGGVDGDHDQHGGMAIIEEQSPKRSGCNSESTTSSLPPWLQQYKEEKSQRESNNDQDSVPVKDLKRWSAFCTSWTDISQPQPSPSFERSLSFSSISPSSTLNFSSYDNHYLKSSPALKSFEPKNFWINELPSSTHEHNKGHPQQKQTVFPMSSNPSSTPTSTSSSEIRDQMESQCVLPRFNEYNADNLRMLCNALEQKAPTHKEIVFEIASTVLHCRSGMAKRKGKHVSKDNNEHGNKEETCLFFHGGDVDAKEKIARELARLIFGSEDKLVSIALSSFSSTRAEASEDRNKRVRDEQNCNYVERFAGAISSNPHRVFFLEDIEQVDYSSQMGIKKAIERGRIPKYVSREEASFCDAVIILSCERFRSRSRACSPSAKHKANVSSREDDQASSSISLDLNISINGGEEDEDTVAQGESMDEIGLLSSVDRCIFFKNFQEK